MDLGRRTGDDRCSSDLYSTSCRHSGYSSRRHIVGRERRRGERILGVQRPRPDAGQRRNGPLTDHRHGQRRRGDVRGVEVDEIPPPAFDTRGRITAFSIDGVEEKTIDGVKRMHLTEGGITTIEVTVAWTNQQLTALWLGKTPANPPPPAVVYLYDSAPLRADPALGRWLSLLETNELSGGG